MEAKFKEGDIVAVRPFDEIDLDDIGNLQYENRGIGSQFCYGIGRNHIDKRSQDGYAYRIASPGDDYRGTYVYRLEYIAQPDTYVSYTWAQGMLRGIEDGLGDEEIEPPDSESLIGFLFG